MASTTTWYEYNGSGCVESAANTYGCSFMSTDAVETASNLYQSNPIASGANSVVKYEALKFTGTGAWNNLSSLYYTIDNNAPAAGLTFVANYNVTPYATPVAGPLSASSFQTTSSTSTKFGGTSFTTGAANTTGPFVTSGSQVSSIAYASSATGTVYGMAFAAQLQVNSSYVTPGNIATRTITATWTES